MLKHKKIGFIAIMLMTISILSIIVLYLYPNIYLGFTSTSTPLYTKIMDNTKILSVQIIADEKEWQSMIDSATEEKYISATVIINNSKIENVGIRPKGNSSLSMVARDDTTDRYSFKIEFDHYIKGQTWEGLDKLVLNNMQGDATYLKEYISYDIMNYIGVNSPLFSFADISLNGKTWGFYLTIESMEDSYAKRLYGKDHGRLYKPESMGIGRNGQMDDFIKNQDNRPPEGGFNGPPDQGLGNKDNNGISLKYIDNNISSYSAIFDTAVFDSSDNDYKKVIISLEKLSKGEDLEKIVDVPAVLKYFAGHTVVVNLDSYISNMSHNYYLYEHNGQLTILPWDYNLAFGGFQSKDASSVVNFPIDTPVSGVTLEDRPILGKLLENPEYLTMYHKYLKEIVTGYFDSGLFEQKVDDMNKIISSYVKNDPSKFYDYNAYTKAITEFKKLGLLRSKSISLQLEGTIPSTTDAQTTNKDLLLDSSNIDLSLLGSMGGRGPDGNFGVPNEVDHAKMRKEMDTILSQSRFEQQPTKTFNKTYLILIVACGITIIIGIVFVLVYKRRR